MSVFIEILAWIVIVFGAVAVVVTLVRLEAGRHARNRQARPRLNAKGATTCSPSRPPPRCLLINGELTRSDGG
jgi:hypothetical protein